MLWLESSRQKGLVISIPARVMSDVAGRVGVQFQYQNIQQKAEIVDLVYGDSQHLEARLERRRKRISFFAAYLYIARKSAAGLGNHVQFVMLQSVYGVMQGLHRLFMAPMQSLWTVAFPRRLTTTNKAKRD